MLLGQILKRLAEKEEKKKKTGKRKPTEYSKKKLEKKGN